MFRPVQWRGSWGCGWVSNDLAHVPAPPAPRHYYNQSSLSSSSSLPSHPPHLCCQSPQRYLCHQWLHHRCTGSLLTPDKHNVIYQLSLLWLVHIADMDKTKLSYMSHPCRWCELNWRQDKIVLSCLDPVSNVQLFSLKYTEDYWKLAIGNRVKTRQNSLKLGQDKRKLSCLVCSCGQDKTVLSCPCRQCQQAIRVHTS